MTDIQEESEIVQVKDLDKIKAELEVIDIEPDLETEKAKVTIQLEVSHESRVARERLVVHVDMSEDQIEKFNEAFEDGKKLVSKELDDIKSDFEPLQTIHESLTISLDEILKRIFDEVVKIFGPVEPETSSGKGRVTI